MTKTRKDAPRDEMAKNAQLLIRAGFIHKEMAGAYHFLPLGRIVFNRIVETIREEMNSIGGQEVAMTALQNPEPWKASGRWDDEVVDVWFKTQLATGQEVGLGTTHEEPMTNMMRQFISSYKDLPAYPFQFQSKFRNEVRSKSGIMRTREFVMKDMYSFVANQEEHDRFYEVSKQAYVRIFSKLGIGDKTHLTLASGGSFSKYSHEFQTECDAGEDLIFYDKASDTYYNREVAPSRMPVRNKKAEAVDLHEVKAEGVIGVEALCRQFGIDIEHTTKTLIFTTDDKRTIFACLRGDYEVNDIKLSEAVGCSEVKLADQAAVTELCGCDIGYAGILHIPEGVEVVYDDSLDGLCNFETGMNKQGYHASGVNFGRDVDAPKQFHDIKLAKDGDLDPISGKPFRVFKAAEVGNIFTLGTKFSKALNLTFTDETGAEHPVLMGSYGIGPARVMGVVAELMSDEKGLVWPAQIAPAQVHIVRIGDDEDSVRVADELYDSLGKKGISALYDDRAGRVGEMLADADLMGIPLRAVVSERSIKAGGVEVTQRQSGATEILSPDALIAKFVTS